MNFKILKRSLKTKKSINVILLVFVMMATMFIAGSVNNMIIIMGATDTFFEKAELGDYLIISNMGGTKEKPTQATFDLEKYLDESQYVDSYSYSHVMYSGLTQFKKEDGSQIELPSNVMLSADIKQQKFFNDNNEIITQINDGEIYLTRREYDDNNLNIGDKIYYELMDGSRMYFTVAGVSKDAFLGADMMGTHRFLISENDMNELLDTLGNEAMMSRLYSIKCNDVEKFSNEYSKEELFVMFGCDWATLKTTFAMDMITAALFMLISVLLVVISIVILRFTILFTINEDYKEIGIMKAIGIGDTGIRKLYISKYTIITVIGAIIGFCASIPFSRAMLKPAMKNLIIENGGSNIHLQLILSVAVAGMVILFAYISTRKIKKFTPMDAIRSGNNGERFKKKGKFKLGGSGFRTTSFMALNDVFSEFRKYLILLFATMVGVWMVIMPANTINTLRSENIADWFGVQKSDIVLFSDEDVNAIILSGKKETLYEKLDEYKGVIEEKGYKVSEGHAEMGWSGVRVTCGDKVTKTIVLQGVNADLNKYVYEKGVAPRYENEVAITHVVAERLGADIGDTVYLNIEGEQKAFVITAIYQSMNNMGEGLRVHENVAMNYSSASICFGFQYNFIDEYSPEKKEDILEELTGLMTSGGAMDVKGFINKMIGGISDSLVPIKNVMLIIVIIINAFIVMLMQKMFVIREKGEIAMLKSVGFSNGKIVKWQTKRIALVLFVGIILGTITGVPFSQITAGQVFKFMGASSITFEIKALEVYVIYPVVIFVVSLLMCVLAMLGVKKINVNDMNEID